MEAPHDLLLPANRGRRVVSQLLAGVSARGGDEQHRLGGGGLILNDVLERERRRRNGTHVEGLQSGQENWL